MAFISSAQAAKRWGISQYIAAILCDQQRIEGAQKAGHTCIIPETAKSHWTLESKLENTLKWPPATLTARW